jgi:hypothetical protein
MPLVSRASVLFLGNISTRFKEDCLILVKIAIGVAAIAWWLLCEYLRAGTCKPLTARSLGILGFGGGWALIFLAVVL